LERCKIQLFTYYRNSDTKFCRDDFHDFNQLLEGTHESIFLKWDANLNFPCEQLAFVFGTEQVFAIHDGSPVTRDVWAALIEEIKAEVSGIYPSPFFLAFYALTCQQMLVCFSN
jgi:hypothetical protein